MARPQVFLTRRWPDAVEARLMERYDVVVNRSDRQLGLFQFREALRRYDAVLPCATDHFTEETLDVPGARARILASMGTGHGHICTAAAARMGMIVTHTPDVVSECIADLAMTLMLMVARRTGEGEREIRAGRWTGWRPTHLVGTRVSGKVLGLVGFGRVGQAVARRAHHGFGMDVIVVDPRTIPAGTLAATGARQVASLAELLPQCDVVSLHCPGGPQTRQMIGGAEFDLMRPGAFLVNTADAGLIDEHALIQALSFDTIGGAALDLCDGGPRIAPALLECDNLVMLPQMGNATREAREAMGERVMANLDDFFEGRDPRDRVT
ncbi:2-hydroxyacid dehydrogenase [Marinibacterium sp. SX1]|uniref:2-hydroxyacid dehydrogenase n=1 Tax=Marinibacterium sp. SX1 TaxID=3388424 RepID=UPI003D1774FC